MLFRASVASCLALLLLVGCGSEEEASPGATTAPTTTEPIQTIATVPETAPAIVAVYFLRDGKVGAASRAVVAGPQIGRAAMMELLEGPGRPEQAAGMRTSIPSGTQLEGLSISKGLAEVELSQPLDTEANAQVVHTLTQFPTVRMVSIEHMQPRSRADLEEFSPSVLVESPTPGEQVSSPLRITGTANTFEATFNVEVVDEQGRVLGKRFVTATSGSGTRGTFDAEVPFKANGAGPGTLRVFELSAEDGSRIHEVEIPLQIAP
jgi:immunoglobulin-like protein involved in spore germination/sporulation and spore germination protein